MRLPNIMAIHIIGTTTVLDMMVFNCFQNHGKYCTNKL